MKLHKPIKRDILYQRVLSDFEVSLQNMQALKLVKYSTLLLKNFQLELKLIKCH